jgi:hypothetical protein
MRNEKDLEQLKMKLLSVMTDHIGNFHAIGMAELFEEVTGEVWEHRINDTRVIRKLITDLRKEGRRICSTSRKDGGGYYLAAAGSELVDYLRKNKIRALKLLSMNAKIKRINLPNYLGQIKLEMEAGDETGIRG